MLEKVLQTERIFPVPDEGLPSVILNEYGLEEFASLIADRLMALEQNEPPPKVSPEVLRAWRVADFRGRLGLTARSPG